MTPNPQNHAGLRTKQPVTQANYAINMNFVKDKNVIQTRLIQESYMVEYIYLHLINDEYGTNTIISGPKLFHFMYIC